MVPGLLTAGGEARGVRRPEVMGMGRFTYTLSYYYYIIIIVYYSKIVPNHDYFIIFYIWDINSNSSFFSNDLGMRLSSELSP